MFGSFRARDIFQSTQPSQAVTRKGTVRVMVMNISIHTALAGCDVANKQEALIPQKFQSTQPSQAVTGEGEEHNRCGRISIHTALAGCDSAWTCLSHYWRRFQSTQPSQAVTGMGLEGWKRQQFQSTQPSQAVTNHTHTYGQTMSYFNPHSPRRL